jgi:hypothetical protein
MRPSRKSIGGMSAMSAAVHAAMTPGSARAAAASRETILPCAWLVRETDVADELAAAGDQGRIFQARDRLPDPIHGFHRRRDWYMISPMCKETLRRRE